MSPITKGNPTATPNTMTSTGQEPVEETEVCFNAHPIQSLMRVTSDKRRKINTSVEN
jgi:hypothetical protein